MKKLIAIVMVALAVITVGCSDKNTDTATLSRIERETLSRVDSILIAASGKRTKVFNKKILFSSEKDSICVIECTIQFNTVSGRSSEGRCEYVFYPKGYGYDKANCRKDLLIDLSTEQSIIEHAKDFADECERDMEPSRRDSASTWQECMSFVVPLRFMREDVERLKELRGY